MCCFGPYFFELLRFRGQEVWGFSVDPYLTTAQLETFFKYFHNGKDTDPVNLISPELPQWQKNPKTKVALVHFCLNFFFVSATDFI